MDAHRLQAPSSDGALLAVPPLAQARDQLAANANRLSHWDADLQGRTALCLRSVVRKQVLETARGFLRNAGIDHVEPGHEDRLVVTGHQPELFHPGVWVKNFAVATIARHYSAAGLNLIVDNDVPKFASIKVPRRVNGGLKVERIAYDDWGAEAPHEDFNVREEALFATFGDRVCSAIQGVVADPIIDAFWPSVLENRALTRRAGLRFSMARRALEADWGAQNLEVPLSAVCETEGFLSFAAHLLAHLPRFHRIHNESLRHYRALYRIRSRHHPVPMLGRQGDWLEAPFWAWRSAEGRRRPLLARQLARSLVLRMGGEDEPIIEVPLAPDRPACCAVEQLLKLPTRGIRLRSRALTTTIFARYFLGDLFVHGIGGAKYDELGDEISGRFYDFDPPSFLTLSMTLWLSLNADLGAAERLGAVDRELRDLRYNPDRHLGAVSETSSEALRWVEAKRSAIAGPVETHAQRLERFREIRRCNEALQGLVADRRAALFGLRPSLESGLARNKVATDREFSFVLHSASRLRAAVAHALSGLAATPSGV
jgi:hypothetical protein